MEQNNDVLVVIYYKGLKDPIKNKISQEGILKDMDEIVKKLYELTINCKKEELRGKVIILPRYLVIKYKNNRLYI